MDRMGYSTKYISGLRQRPAVGVMYEYCSAHHDRYSLIIRTFWLLGEVDAGLRPGNLFFLIVFIHFKTGGVARAVISTSVCFYQIEHFMS
jgi:hypothetical protein